MATQNKNDHQNHVAVCLDNQRRIETRFTSIEAKLDKQNDESLLFRNTLQARMDQIRENDNRRYAAMLLLAITSLLGIIATGSTVAAQIILHLWKVF